MRASLSPAYPGSFQIGAALPLLMVIVAPVQTLVEEVRIASLVFPALLGAVAEKAGGAPILRATTRARLSGALAIAVTAGIGAAFGNRI